MVRNFNGQAKVDLYSLDSKLQFTFVIFGGRSAQSNGCSGLLGVSKKPGVIYNPLVIFGGPGIGKTHLLHAVAQVMLKTIPLN